MKITTPYGKTKIYSVPREAPGTERIMVVPGFTETITHNKKLVRALAHKGFDAETFSQPRSTGPEPRGDRLHPIDRQGEVLLDIIDATVPKGEKVHAVAHSIGAAATLKAAIKNPERFASITLMQPVGTVEDMNFPELAARTGVKTVKNHARALRSQNPDRRPTDRYTASVDKEGAASYSGRVAAAQVAGLGLIGSQPVIAMEEALAVPGYDIAEDLAKVYANGIPVHLVDSHGDELFDATKANTTHYPEILDYTASISSVADRHASHDTFWMQPERTAAIIGQLIHRT